MINHAIHKHNYSTLSEVCVVRSSLEYIDIPVIVFGTFGGNEDHVMVLYNGTIKYRRRIRINKNRCPLSSKHQKALVGLHAFSGNDFVSIFFLRKLKKICSTQVESNEEFTYLHIISNTNRKVPPTVPEL